MKKKMTFKEFSVSLVILTVLAILAVGWWNGKLSLHPSPSPAVGDDALGGPSPSPAVGDGVLDVPPAAILSEDAAEVEGSFPRPTPKPTPMPTPTPRPTPKPTPLPSPSPTVGDGVLDVPPSVILSEGAAEVEGSSEPTVTYVLNLNTKKFHYPDCSSVEQIKPKNYEAFTGSREEVIARGFVPCKNCNP